MADSLNTRLAALEHKLGIAAARFARCPRCGNAFFTGSPSSCMSCSTPSPDGPVLNFTLNIGARAEMELQ